MDRLLSEQEVLNTINAWFYELSEQNISTLQGMIKAIPSAEPKWIPVTEKPPEDEQEVLITYKINVKHHVWSAIWDKLHGRFYDKEYRSYISLNYVTAWMPLPESYKAERE